MIFDSPQMIALRERFKNIPNYEVPEIVFLDRYLSYSGERDLLEALLRDVSNQKQLDWLGRLVSEDPSQHIGAWFEIMLFGWLKEYFTVQVEPEILGNYPDFVLDVQNTLLAIEARAFLTGPEERERRSKLNRILSTLGSIEKPFIVMFKIERLGEKIDTNKFSEDICRWLDVNADQDFIYKDNCENIIRLSAKQAPQFKKLGASSSEGFHINPDVLKVPLSKKASQHKALRKAGTPYVIAIFLEPSHLSAEEVIEAWIGKLTAVYDIESDQIVEEKFDESGIRFFGKEIVHKSVAGILVFKASHAEAKKTRYLDSWYVQNPHATMAIDPYIFPVNSRFIVIGQDNITFEMKWVK